MPNLLDFPENMPPAIKAMIGDISAMAQLEGFLRAKLFDPLPLLLAIFVVSQGASLIAGEVENKSIDLLLARPVSRRRVVVGKFLAMVTATVCMTLVLFVCLILCSRFIEAESSARNLLLSTLNGLPLTWASGAAALLGSCLLPRARHASMIVGGLVVGFYVWETLRQLSPSLRPYDEFSLLALHKSGVTLAGQIHLESILVLLGAAAVLLVGAVVAFDRRDLVS
jgi:ABC-2 type transport system permease protein